MLDDLVHALTRERAGNAGGTVSVNEAIRTAIREAHEHRAGQLGADRAAWAELVARAGGETALLTLHGEGAEEPLPERRSKGTTPDGRRAVYVTPPRWKKMRVTAALDGIPIDVPLLVEEPPMADLHFDVFLTDAAGAARVYLGPLSRIVEGHPAYYDNRLFRIARDLGLCSANDPDGS